METEDHYFLKKEVYFEPLINRWYAWAYLMPPAQASRYMTSTHLRLMKSFVKNAKLHIIGSQQLIGGEFLNCKEEQISSVSNLIEITETKCIELIQLSEAISELDEMLRGHISGESLEPLYEKVPEVLKGYVELVLDLEHRPSYRILEGLLYRSKFYRQDLQSVIFGMISRVNERPFILSTPRLPDEDHLHVELPFNSEELKTLLSTRDNPIPMAQIEDIFEGAKCEGGLNYKELFTTTPPRPKDTGFNDELKITYTGHAGFLIETPETTILVDPVIACHDEKSPSEMVDYSLLPKKIDYICLTHSHLDHTQIETLLQLRHKTRRILVPKNNSGSLVDPSLKLMLKQLDFSVTEMDDLDSITITNGNISAIPFLGEHGDLNIRSKTAWLIEVSGKKLFFGADSSCLDKTMYMRIFEYIGKIDMLAIGMECVGAPYTWLYGALHTRKVDKHIKESRRLNGADSHKAIEIVDIFNPKQVYIYALGAEPCYKYFMGLEYDETSMQITESRNMTNMCLLRNIDAKTLIGSQRISV